MDRLTQAEIVRLASSVLDYPDLTETDTLLASLSSINVPDNRTTDLIDMLLEYRRTLTA